MSEFIKTQEEARANLTMQIREVIDGAEADSRGLDSAELQKIDRIESDIRKADEALEVARRSADRLAQASEASRGLEVVEEARGAADVFRSMANGEIRGHNFTMEKRATLVPSVNTVPIDFLDRVYALAKLVGPYLETSEVFNRDSGSDLRVPVMTAYSTATETAAGAAMDESENTYGSLLLQPAKQGFIVKLANELISDAGFDIESSIAENAGVAIGTRVNTIVNAAVEAVAGAGVTAASATAITADELIELAFSTDGMVRLLPGSGFMVAPSTMALIRKLKDSDGRYILDPIVSSVDGNASATLLGFPVYENPAVDAATTGNQAAFFGHWPSVKIATTGLQVATSTDAYFANDITGYRFTYRVAAGVANGSSHISKLTMA